MHFSVSSPEMCPPHCWPRPAKCAPVALPAAKCPLILFARTFVSSAPLSGGKDDAETPSDTQNVASEKASTLRTPYTQTLTAGVTSEPLGPWAASPGAEMSRAVGSVGQTLNGSDCSLPCRPAPLSGRGCSGLGCLIWGQWNEFPPHLSTLPSMCPHVCSSAPSGVSA